MQDKLRQAIKAIHGQKIPELPEEIIELDKEISSKFANMGNVADIISKNTTLSGELMRLINSPAVKLKEPVNSIREAVTVMGLTNISNLLVAAAIKNIFGSKGLSKDIMDHSVDVAFCMADLSEWVHGITRDEAYMLGLFHNVGAMMLAAKDEETYAGLFRDSMSKPVSAIRKEEEVFDSNHAMIGVLIGQKWRLPVNMLNAIMLHHNEKCERIKNDQVRAMVAMIKVANAIVSEVSLGAYRSEEMRNYEQDGISELMLDSEEVQDIRSSLMCCSLKS
ncbi:HDOD domain-containing protein [Thiomicrorhabdus sp. Kp2]|uniref:HDOD domain-containing protein n=1 Tax=Thiomicrorhabdus sp. Kp2 TaxID=1123518 RepID=UPI00042A7FE4|nr:HDOD domain-containing protein [Thiomicrorhabdus sp. Kp2]